MFYRLRNHSINCVEFQFYLSPLLMPNLSQAQKRSKAHAQHWSCPGWEAAFSYEIRFQCNCPVLWSRCACKHALLLVLHLSSAHSALQCACAMETVSCNDISTHPPPVLCLTGQCVHIAAPLIAMTTKMEFARVRG